MKDECFFRARSQTNLASCRKRLQVKHNKAKGFTLLELAVTMVIVAIMVVWGAPGLQRTLESMRLRSVVSEFRSAFSIARFESYGQGRRLVIAKNCALSGPPATSCNNVNWSKGYTVFVCRASETSDQEASEQARSSTANDCLMTPQTNYSSSSSKQVFEGFNSRIRICSSATGTQMHNKHVILFNPNGKVGVSDGTTSEFPTNLNFFIAQDTGTVDLAYSLQMSGDGHLTANYLSGQDVINSTSGGAGGTCETN